MKKSATTFGFGLMLVVLVVGAVLGYSSARRLITNDRRVAHTHGVILDLATLLSTLKDAETGQRGYLITGDERYLQPYENGVGRVQSEIARLKRLTAETPDQHARMMTLDHTVGAKLAELKRTVALAKGGAHPAAIQIVRSNAGRNLMDQIRVIVAAMQQVEQARLVRRAEESRTSARTAVLSILLPASLGIMLLGVVFLFNQRNLTLRQQAMDAVGEQRERLQVTLASIGDAVITTDESGNITYLNMVAEDLTGWTHDSASGQPLENVFRIVNESTREPAENPVQKVLQCGQISGLANHTILIRKDRTERAIDDSAAPIRDNRDRVVGVVLVFRDITERRKAEAARDTRNRLTALRADTTAALASNEERRTVLQECTEALVRYLDMAFARIWTIQEGEHVLELQASAEMYTHLDGPHGRVEIGDLKIGRIAESRQPHLTNDVTHDPSVSDPEWARREGMVAFAGYPLVVEGRVLGVAAMFARKPLAEEFITDLAPLADSIAMYLDRKRIEERLQEADRRKDEFIATLAHELRNPLAPIRNALQLLRLSGDSAETVEQVRTMMERQLQQMVRLIDDLMDVSRITRNRLALRKERVELAAVVRSSVESSRPLIEQSGHELIITLPAEPIYLDADLTRLAQVFSNLLNNSAKYTDRGGRIWLIAEQQGSEVVVKVRDTGVGIPATMLPHVFEMFTQVDPSLERTQGGLGIGLGLVRGLVEMHGGSVEAKSDGPGEGSEFTVRLPVLETGKPTTSPGTGDAGAYPSSRRRVLVVDDNRDAAESLAMVLELMGHEVHTAHDGLEAVDAAAEFRPEVVLLDIGLPQMNGYDAARKIREAPWGKEMLLIATTGWGQDEDRRRSLEAGFNLHVVKPIDPAGLEQLLAGPQAPMA